LSGSKNGEIEDKGACSPDFAMTNEKFKNLAGVYIISFTDIDNSIGTFWGTPKKRLNDLGLKGGIGFRF